MFAVVRTGGKQYCVKAGDVIKVEKLEAEPASVISLTDVLMTGSDAAIAIGKTTVTAEVMRHMRDKKIIVFKKKRRHNYRRKNGHRQWMTVLKITGISPTKGE